MGKSATLFLSTSANVAIRGPGTTADPESLTPMHAPSTISAATPGITTTSQ